MNTQYRKRKVDAQTRESGIDLILRGFHFGEDVEDTINEFKNKQCNLNKQIESLKQLDDENVKKELTKKFKNDIKTNLTLRDTACYNIALAIEMLLKGMCSYYGQTYVPSHFIKRNVSILENQARFDKELNEISGTLHEMQTEISVTISQWINIARYTTVTPDEYNNETEDDLMREIDTTIGYFNILSSFIRRHDLDQYN